jgi:predicted nicotinamide N-methyase
VDDAHDAHDAAGLARALESQVPGVRLAPRATALVPELTLWLMSDDFPTGRLSNDAMRALLDAPPYWAFCWGSGSVLARFVLDHEELVRGKTVLDFGAGSGVVAIAAARAGARRAVACDADPSALHAVRVNARRNGVQVELRADYFATRDETVDVIVAADVLYDEANRPLLAHFREHAATVLVADSRVRDFDVPGYRQIGLRECRVTPDLIESEDVSRVKIYRAGRS